ncbi:MAG: translation initiation factor IF-2 [Thermoplasmatales archaeon]|nr:translation initiation factor IF-2 [Candidatus Thermoplasmatota archaeon]MCL6002876.1 translation initiation factor IF-2 [Candidatus Thermoplasmatota archaeon]MDA8056284.1 translation initiation factor IF-2 [Thermoplasmatales archaeon]
MWVRQPIVGVLGHVDHGKTSLLDNIRGGVVAAREAGGITQHIGATEVPIQEIVRICADIIGSRSFKIPGLLFIDTPGHESFSSLRIRGGSIADIAVLVIDVREGIMPQTRESLEVLKKFKTPFVVAANKVDLIEGFSGMKGAFIPSIKNTDQSKLEELDNKLFQLSSQLYREGFSADRYDRISDFTRNVAIVPLSAKSGYGVPDLLMVLSGLAQTFLESQLRNEEETAEGTILEVREEKGMGEVSDAILYSGVIKRGETVLTGTVGGIKALRVKGIFKPKPLDEIRDPRDRFLPVSEVRAASGIRILFQGEGGVIPGSPFKEATGDLITLKKSIEDAIKGSFRPSSEGIVAKADTVGGLEALVYELSRINVPIKKAEVGPVSKRDFTDAGTNSVPENRIIIAFNVPVEVKDFQDVRIIENKIIYSIKDDLVKTREEIKQRELEQKRKAMTFPCKLLVMEGNVFRVSKPAIFGVRIIGGKLRVRTQLMKIDGSNVGPVKSIRTGEQSLDEANQGDEVAIAMDNITVGRQIREGDILYSDINERDFRLLKEENLNIDENMIMDDIKNLRRKTSPFWGS